LRAALAVFTFYGRETSSGDTLNQMEWDEFSERVSGLVTNAVAGLSAQRWSQILD